MVYGNRLSGKMPDQVAGFEREREERMQWSWMSRIPCPAARGVATLAALVLVLGAEAQRGATERVSVSSAGGQGNDWSVRSSISGDGRYVAFNSYASNLVPNDTNYALDVFVRDRVAGQTTRVSVSSSGAQGNDGSWRPSISADGRFVAFYSYAYNLVPGDTNAAADVFVHDRLTSETTRVSVSSSGAQAYGSSTDPSISADGRFVAFASFAPDLVPNDTNRGYDVFVHDRATGETTRISVSSSGEQGNNWSWLPSISADGRYVAFESFATNFFPKHMLAPDDTNNKIDAFVHDRVTCETRRVSVSSSGEQGNRGSWKPSVSADGRFVAFESEASNLVPHDTNDAMDVFIHDSATGQTKRISVSASGEQGNGWSANPAISVDGRFVAFDSDASNLVSDDRNGWKDVFVHDRAAGEATLVSVPSWGGQANERSLLPAVSADGRFVAFQSLATNLVTNDTNGHPDVFVHQYGPDDECGSR